MSVTTPCDNAKLYRTITSVHDSNALQQDIDSISVWGEQSLMSFNLDSACNDIWVIATAYSYTMKNADGIPFPLQWCHWCEEQDLGVLFTPNLKFSEHMCISKITRKVNSVVGII